ncbi:hypothetical protein PLESTB_000528000 [Pleodorina starrii]|uniref:SPX domain-containing protein n=1 Tax=Pleodorina starrii TaxID=330485 RepID=A0A9W6F0U1_9CHLO|nr:hypothetical protein PLESTM_000391400 [Pleodorina starrii]GLC51675.1 hypothetical protein PLESTB_000528000 [Pleodorina starrii]
MKFGKVLKVSSENMPEEMHDLFLRYKELKKQIKLIPVSKDAAVGNEKQASVSPDGSNTGSGSTGASVTATVLSPEELAFITTLNEDLARFNRYFIEKEEEAVIRIQALCDELAAAAAAAGLHLPAALTNAATIVSDQDHDLHDLHVAASAGAATAMPAVAAAPAAAAAVQPQRQPEAESLFDSPPGEPASMPDADPGQATPPSSAGLQQQQPEGGPQQQAGGHHHHHHHHHQGSAAPHIAALQAVKSRLVQFHGEMVLLLHWSLLNYAAVVKILKKHDKRTGVLLRAPYLANVLQQPFSSTTIMSRLAKRAEELVVATTQLSPGGGGAVLATGVAAGGVGAAPGARPAAAGAAAAAAPTAASAGPSVDEQSNLPGGSSFGQGPPGRSTTAAAAAPSGRGGTSASEVSTLTFAVDREGTHGDVGARAEPLVGSTMHALETWANLRKNAITPSTVLTAEVEQQQQQQQPPAKRKAETPAPEADTDTDLPSPEGKAARLDAPPAEP